MPLPNFSVRGQFFNTSPNPYLVLDRNLNIVDANQAYLDSTRRKLNDIVGRWAWDAFPTDPETLKQSVASFERVIRTRKTDTMALLRFDIPRPEADGEFEVRYWSITHTPVLDEHGEVEFVLQNPVDVTELQRLRAVERTASRGEPVNLVPPQVAIFSRAQSVYEANLELQADLDRLTTLFQKAPGFMAIMRGPGHVYEFVNDALLKLMGQRQYIGRTVREAIPELEGQGYFELLDQVYATGEPFVGHGMPAKLQRTPGAPPEERFMNFIYQPIIESDGRIGGIFIEGADVTEQHLAHRDLQDKLRRLEAAQRRRSFLLELSDRLRSLSDDPDAIMSYATEALAHVLDVPRVGYASLDESEKHAVIGHNFNDTTRVPPLPALTGWMNDYALELINELRTGRIMKVDKAAADPRTRGAAAAALLAIGARAVLAVPVQRSRRTVAFIFAHDSSPRHWSDDDAELVRRAADHIWEAVERARAVAALRDTDRRKDEFLAMLAHELRNPLAPISSAAQILRIKPADESRVRQTSEIILRQVEHMTGLVDDLLDVSRVTRGLIKLEKTEVDAKTVLSGAIEQVRPLIEIRGHHLSVHVSSELALVHGDAKRLIQIVVNLLNNATKYTPEGGNLSLSLVLADQQVIITVADNGVGMAPEVVSRAFELFAQAERTSDRSQGGLGIGLAVVKGLVDQHGGKITASSQGLGCGSTFTVYLPCITTQTVVAPFKENRTGLVAAPKPLKILIVDDNIDAAHMLAMLVEALGYKAIIEHGSRHALERASLEVPDICLLDIGLPYMDGHELAHRLRSQPETAKSVLVAVSGYGQERDRVNAANAGFDRHFVKPVDMQRLTEFLVEIDENR